MRTFLISALLASVAMPAHAELLFRNNYDGNLALGAGVSASSIDPVSASTDTAHAVSGFAPGWAGNFYHNFSSGNPAEISQLTLTNLAPHTQVSVSFLLGFLDSWDGPAGGFPQGDLLDILIDNVVVATLTASTASGSSDSFAGGTLICAQCQIDDNIFYSDKLVDMSSSSLATFAHSGSTLTFGIRAYGPGWQGGTDESWGIDDILMTYNASPTGGVPEPASWAMMLAGFGFAGGAIRRRKAAIA